MNTTLKWILGIAGVVIIAGALLMAGVFAGRMTSAWNPMGGSLGYGEMMGRGFSPDGFGHGGMMGRGFGDGEFGPGGMMNGWGGYDQDIEVDLTEEEALQLATDYVASEYPGAVITGDAFLRQGIYHWELQQDGETAGRVMVDGNSGDVFAHTWSASSSDN
ncbi:MAG: hypothetical protein EPO32_04065 [Anaerolineae bacterium]|nr:MAG: hypothetical protein EPO32_04065 [Anaerolineae bacterium]